MRPRFAAFTGFPFRAVASSPDDGGAELLFWIFLARRDILPPGPGLATSMRLALGVVGRETLGVATGVDSADDLLWGFWFCARPGKGGSSPMSPACASSLYARASDLPLPCSSSRSCWSKYSSKTAHSTRVVLGFLSCSA